MNVRVCSIDDVRQRSMREFDVDGTKVLVVHYESGFAAFSGTCPHYGAPLADGVFSDDRIVCPWHHACFDARSGDLLEPPALDALASFPVTTRDGTVFVDLPEAPPDRRELPARAPRRVDADRIVAIIGGGAAGLAAAQTLRERGDERRIVMLSADDRPPYDRPNASKDYLAGNAAPEWMPLRGEEFYRDQRIELELGCTARRIDAAARVIELVDGSHMEYEAALLASGCRPRSLRVPGAHLANVFTLRSMSDADRIAARAERRTRAVVIGASFIAMEAAASLRARGLEVTVIAPDRIPFERTLGPEIGAHLRAVHEANGVVFRLGWGVRALDGDGRVEAVVLANSERIACRLVVIGVGVEPATDMLEGVEREQDGGVRVDEHLRAAEGLYAAGDVAAYPDPRTGERIRIEHWRTALQLGRVAAANIAGAREAFDRITFFWTQQHGFTLRYVGHARTWDEIVVRGDVASGRFIAYFMRDGLVHAAATAGRDRDAIAVAESMRRRGLPALDHVPT